MPTVFIGHPFAERFAVRKFREIFKDLPFQVIYGNTDIQTKHLLQIMKQNIRKSDYSIFDLSGWNSNVALELGLVEGINSKSNRPYYIILNTKRSKEVPSDIRGLQRIEYVSYDYKVNKGLGYQIIKYILSKEHLYKKIEKQLKGDQKQEANILLSLKIIAHTRENEIVTSENVVALGRGLRLRKDDRDKVMKILRDLRIIRKNKNIHTRFKKVFRPK
jgi:hypothetical protein